KVITITYHVAANVEPATVNNTATATDDDGNTDQGSDTVDIFKQLSLSKAFQENPVTAGTGGHTFTIAVTNHGPSDVDGVDVTDTIDSRLQVDNVVVTTGTGTCSDADNNPQTLECALGTLGPNELRVITVTYHVAADVEPDTVNNTVTATDDDGNTDQGSDTVGIIEQVSLDVTKAFQEDVVSAGTGNHTFTITVTNNGPS